MSYFIPRLLTPVVGQICNKTQDIQFTWGWDTDYSSYNIIGARLHISTPSGALLTSKQFSGDVKSYVLPANTLGNEDYYAWQIGVWVNNSSNYIESARWFFYPQEGLPKCENLSPNGKYLNGDQVNVFNWRHVIPTGTAPGGADLQYSNDNVTWSTFAHISGVEQSVAVPAGSLPSGNVFWRVRSYNSAGAPGEWSAPAVLVVLASPVSPVIAPPGGIPRPLLNWQSTDQQAFEIRADDWTSGAIFGTGKSYQLPLWLKDGAHTLSVRIQSSLGLWSDWASVEVTVSNQPPGEIELLVRGIENGVRLDYDEGFDSYLIYRDGVQIAEATATTFRDYLTNGKHKYQVRGVKGNYYTLSSEVVEISRCAYGVLSAVDEIDWIPLKTRRGSVPSHSASLSRPTKLRYFTGREKPVAEVSEFMESVHTLEYTFKGRYALQLARLRALLGKTVVYKNQHGVLIIGTLSENEQKNDWASDVTLTITETDWREGNA